MIINVVSLKNVSAQTVPLIVLAGDPDQNPSGFDFEASGILPVLSGRVLTIEEDRIDFGQLLNLRNLHLITYSVYGVDASLAYEIVDELGNGIVDEFADGLVWA